MRKLFGTDGIRGTANQYPMTPETAVHLGRALTAFFSTERTGSGIVIGKDTRISGDMLESALIAGICSMGTDAYRLGIIPTPGVAFLARELKAKAGIVISASHNPYGDNGIKVFKGDGFKLTDTEEDLLESIILNKDLVSEAAKIKKTGRIVDVPDADSRYTTFIRTRLPGDFSLDGIKLVLDCANGATFRTAPLLFSDLGAGVEALFTSPDGVNINHNCGSQHLETLSKRVVEAGAAAGLAFDGDGDRVVAVDEKGVSVSGDQILAICGNFMLAEGKLKNKRLVSTVMSNFGLGIALKKMGIKHLITDVGDRYVLQQMISADAVLGGEDSGHLIFLNDHTTGDGLLAGLRLIQAMIADGRPLSRLRTMMPVYPQILRNVPVPEQPDLETVSEIAESIRSVEERLRGDGRVLVRYSGTQPLCRVMVEGKDAEHTESYCREIVDTIEKTIGKGAFSPERK